MTTHRLVPFLALEGATLLAGLGNGVAMVAMPWLVLELTGNPAAAGVVAGVSALPMLLASLFSGTMVDQFGRRRTSVVSDIFSAVSVAGIPLVALTGNLTFGWVLALGVLGSVFDPAGVTAREAMLPDVARTANLPLQRVNGIHEAIWGLAFLVGPALGGVLIGLFGAVNALWVMFAGFTASAALLALVHVPGAGRPLAKHQPTFWAGTLDGLKYVWNDRVLRSVTLLSSAFVAITYPVLGIILPVVFEQQGAPERLGVLLMSFSVGGIVGALGYSALGHRVHQRASLLVGMAGGVVSLAWFALEPAYGWLVAGAVLGGVLTGPINPVVNFVLQQRTPELMRGRVMGVIVSVAYGVVPLGYLAAGVVVAAIGTQATVAICAALAGVTLMAAAMSRPLRGMDVEPGPTHVIDRSELLDDQLPESSVR